MQNRAGQLGRLGIFVDDHGGERKMVAFALFLTSARSEHTGVKKHPGLPCSNCLCYYSTELFLLSVRFPSEWRAAMNDSRCIVNRQLATKSKMYPTVAGIPGPEAIALLSYANRNCCCLDCGGDSQQSGGLSPWTCWDSIVILGLGSRDCLVTDAQISSPGSPKRSRGFSRLRWTTR